MKKSNIKFWQDKDGSTGFIRVMASFLIFSGMAMVWFQLFAVVWISEFKLGEVEWMGPLGFITAGLTGKGVQKGLEK